MIENYLLAKADTNYTLFGFFKNNDSIKKIDLVELKAILTWSETNSSVKKVERDYQKEKGISDKQLEGFLGKFKFIVGKKFEEQHLEVIDTLSLQFSCSRQEAELYYYNNALTKILHIAKEKNESNRTVNRRAFLKNIDSKQLLFNTWFRLIKGKEQLLKLTKKHIENCNALYRLKSKVLFIDTRSIDLHNHELSLVIFIQDLVNKYYCPNKSYYDDKPWTVILTLSIDEINAIKAIMIEKGISFNDGFEYLKFSSNIFNQKPVIEAATSKKLLRSSYSIKIISYETLLKNKKNIIDQEVIFFFSEMEPNLYFDLELVQFFSIPFVESVQDIAKIIM